MSAIVVGVDLGTTSCKASAFRLDGELLGHGSAPCTLTRPFPDWVEQEPADYWLSAVEAIRQALASLDAAQVVALACCGHTPGVVLLDSAGQPLRPAIVWQDNRSISEAAWLAEQVPAQQWQAWLGMDLPRSASYPPARLLWLQRHEPQLLARARHFLQPKDYVNFCLTGQVASDYWSNKGLAHLVTGEPIEAYRELLGIDPTLASHSLHPHHLLGHLSAEAARQLGLPEGLPVAVGWTDAMSGMLGTGALAKDGLAFDIAGTSEIVGLTTRLPSPAHAGLLVAPVLDTDLRVVYGPTQTSGAAVAWFLERFWPELAASDERKLDAAVAQAADGLLFLPYLEGERAPLWNADARGVLFGLSLSHTRSHVLRAIFEGVAFSVRHVLETAEQATRSSPAVMHLSGGGAQSQLWNALKATVLGKAVRATLVRDAGTLGAAMLAALAVQAFDSLTSASQAMVRMHATVEPEVPGSATLEPALVRTADYDQSYARYRQLYGSVQGLYTQRG